MNWKPIVDYEGHYSVSDTGLVRNDITWNILQFGHDVKGYAQVALHKNGIRKTLRVATLVAIAFLGNPEGLQINHKNGIKDDNRVENLEWVTPTENMQHAYNIGLHIKPKGTRNSRVKLTEDEVKEIQILVKTGLTQRQIASKFMISQKAIFNIIHHKAWRHIA